MDLIPDTGVRWHSIRPAGNGRRYPPTATAGAPPTDGDGRRPFEGTPAVTLAGGGLGRPWPMPTQSTAGQGPDGGRRDYFFGAALGFSCFGFLFFLSFFWLLLPLPIDRLPSW